MDDSNLEDGAGDGGFDLNDYEGADSPIILHHCFPVISTKKPHVCGSKVIYNIYIQGPAQGLTLLAG